MEAARDSARSRAAHAWASSSMPPMSSTGYSLVTLLHSFAPCTPSLRGGDTVDGGRCCLSVEATSPTTDSGGFFEVAIDQRIAQLKVEGSRERQPAEIPYKMPNVFHVSRDFDAKCFSAHFYVMGGAGYVA